MINMKKWYASKTLWSNAVMLAGVIVLNTTGKDLLTPEVQAAIITIVNVVLRVVTKEEITW
jgi:hypothetical protein